eukprot:TRINITY_DN598_c1_g1_i1.p1 TRINITY_DN598_c1_g1~~TRINITY_DN598_c1_g1_i1.p1  ORF type:complete len:127 (+),score=37.79 TRINITY_DN598_c1_g1_i1:89-469(+)
MAVLSRKQVRRQRTAVQVQQGSRNRYELRNKGSRKHVEAPLEEVEPLEREEVEVRPLGTKKNKLARQLNRLQDMEASSLKITEKLEQLRKATWREARMSDAGTRKGGFKRTAPRAAKAGALINSSL